MLNIGKPVIQKILKMKKGRDGEKSEQTRWDAYVIIIIIL